MNHKKIDTAMLALPEPVGALPIGVLTARRRPAERPGDNRYRLGMNRSRRAVPFVQFAKTVRLVPVIGNRVRLLFVPATPAMAWAAAIVIHRDTPKNASIWHGRARR